MPVREHSPSLLRMWILFTDSLNFKKQKQTHTHKTPPHFGNLVVGGDEIESSLERSLSIGLSKPGFIRLHPSSDQILKQANKSNQSSS